MNEDERLGSNGRWRWGVFVVGLMLLVAIPVRWFVFYDVRQGAIPSDWRVEVVFSGVFAVVVIAVGLWIAVENRVDARGLQRLTVVRCLTGFAFFTVLVAALLHVSGGTAPADFARKTLFAGSIGAAVGVMFGMQEVTSIRRARRAAQRATELDHVIQERERLEYLNAVLRHEVLNNVNIIKGYAELLLAEPTEPPENHLRTICSQADEMTEIITDVRHLIESLRLQEGDDHEPLDIAPILNDEIGSLREVYDVSLVRGDLPEAMVAQCPPAIQRVFRNLLTNAAIHNDSPEPEVTITAECTAESVRIRIADNGPGIPQSEQESLFEVGTEGDHGFGLYVASTILDSCGGKLELTRTGPDGSVFVATIPRPVQDQSRAAVAEAAPA